MENVSFQYNLSDLTLSEVLSFTDFKWPEKANCCMQMTDGEIVFLTLAASTFNLLRYRNQSKNNFDQSSVLKLIKSEHCVFIEGSNLLLLDQIAVDWNVAITREQIFSALLTKLSQQHCFKNSLQLCIDKAHQLNQTAKRTKFGLKIYFANGTEYLIPTSTIGSEFHFIKTKQVCLDAGAAHERLIFTRTAQTRL